MSNWDGLFGLAIYESEIRIRRGMTAMVAFARIVHRFDHSDEWPPPLVLEKSCHPRGVKATDKLPGGSKTIRSLDDTYQNKGLPTRSPLPPGELRHLAKRPGHFKHFAQAWYGCDLSGCHEKVGFVGWGVSESWTSCSKTISGFLQICSSMAESISYLPKSVYYWESGGIAARGSPWCKRRFA